MQIIYFAFTAPFDGESTYLFGFFKKGIFYFTQCSARFNSQEFIIVHPHSVKKKAKEYPCWQELGRNTSDIITYCILTHIPVC